MQPVPLQQGLRVQPVQGGLRVAERGGGEPPGVRVFGGVRGGGPVQVESS
jgi:hypothetical protein